jgi:hypothetical protein
VVQYEHARSCSSIRPYVPSQCAISVGVLTLATSLEGKYATKIIDGNIDRTFVSTALRYMAEERVDAVGVTVMGGPYADGYRRVEGDSRGFRRPRLSGVATTRRSALSQH